MHRHRLISLTTIVFFTVAGLSLIRHSLQTPWRKPPSPSDDPSNTDQDDFEATISRLQEAHPIIQHVLNASGAAGISYGLIHHGHVLFSGSAGYRDVDAQLPIDDETIFPISSMTKAFTSAIAGMLVDEGELRWNTKISDVLQNFEPQSDNVRRTATLVDFLSMRSGLQETDTWLQSQNNIIFPEDQSLTIINNFQQVHPLGKTWDYSNYAYDLMGKVISKAASAPWASLYASRIFQPLNLSRTTVEEDLKAYDNVALAYASLDDGTPVRIQHVKSSSITLMGSATSVKSCMRDLLSLYKAFLAALTHQSKTGSTTTPGLPFKQLNKIVTPHINLPREEFRDSAYALGWFRSSLPGPMCQIGSNYAHVGKMPVVGKGTAKRQIISHYGSMPGALSSVNLFPETESAIIVLTNTLSLSDNADWISQLLAQTLFNFPHQIDYLHWTKKTVEGELAWYGELTAELEISRKPGTFPLPLESYTGVYEDFIGTLRLLVRVESDRLVLNFQNLTLEDYSLDHYENNVFTWLSPRSVLAARGRYTCQTAVFYKIRFTEEEKGVVKSLFWSHDGSINGQEFFKRPSSAFQSGDGQHEQEL